VLNDKNEIFSFGKTTHGRLGFPQSMAVENVHEPTLLESLSNEKVVQISAGCRHAACVTGKIYILRESSFIYYL